MYPTTKAAVDQTFIAIIAVCLLLLALIIFFTVYFLVRYRRSRNPRPANLGGNWMLELAWIVVATVIALGMFFYGLTSFTFLKSVPPDALAVQVTARQWSWLFTYDNGRRSADLVVPLGRPIALTMETKDVIHGFFLPAYRVKQDVVPGMKNRVWFRPTSLGTADILCSQYCGNEHSKMLATLYVVTPEVFEKWLKGEEVDIPGLTS